MILADDVPCSARHVRVQHCGTSTPSCTTRTSHHITPTHVAQTPSTCMHAAQLALSGLNISSNQLQECVENTAQR